MTKISIHACVDIDDVLYDVGEKRLVQAVKNLGYVVSKHKLPPPPSEDVLTEISEAIRERRYGDAETIIDRELTPKWKTFDACEKAYTKICR